MTIEAPDLAPSIVPSMCSPDEIAVRIGSVRSARYEIGDQKIELGLRSIAVPVFDSQDRIVAALNVGALVVQHTAEHLARAYFPAMIRVQTALRSVMI